MQYEFTRDGVLIGPTTRALDALPSGAIAPYASIIHQCDDYDLYRLLTQTHRDLVQHLQRFYHRNVSVALLDGTNQYTDLLDRIVYLLALHAPPPVALPRWYALDEPPCPVVDASGESALTPKNVLLLYLFVARLALARRLRDSIYQTRERVAADTGHAMAQFVQSGFRNLLAYFVGHPSTFFNLDMYNYYMYLLEPAASMASGHEYEFIAWLEDRAAELLLRARLDLRDRSAPAEADALLNLAALARRATETVTSFTSGYTG